MDLNYNPINFDKLKSHFKGKTNLREKIGVDRLFLISTIFFIASLAFFIYTVIANRNTAEFIEGTPDARLRTAIKQALPQIRVITGGFRFQNTAEINFVPKKINKYTFESEEKILAQAKKTYPDFKGEDLKKFSAKLMVTWTALRDFLGEAKEVHHTKLAPVNREISFNTVDAELPILEKYYLADEIKMSGFYLKMRFSGIFEENLKKLNLEKSAAREEAQKMIREYVEKGKKSANPEEIFDELNADEKAKLMNNEESNAKFENYNLYPPLFDDPDFYKMAINLTSWQFSKIFTLKTRNPGKADLEEYAFVSFYVNDKTGRNLGLNALITQFLLKNWIR